MQTREVNQVIAKIPDWVILTQCMAFAILYAIWAQPETILIRHVCLILGALFGVYEIFQYRHSFLTKAALPAWLILALFVWMIFHLFFLSNDFNLQLTEYMGIWKRTAIGFIFALGLGLSLGKKSQGSFWWIIFLGLLSPSLIYFVKYFFTFHSEVINFAMPAYLKLYDAMQSGPFYIPKTSYVIFCLPLFAISLGQIKKNITNKKLISFDNFIYFLTTLLVLLIYYIEGITNGFLYSSIFILIFIIMIIFKYISTIKTPKKIFFLIITFSLTIFSTNYIGGNSAFINAKNNFRSDLRIATHPNEYPQWKNFAIYGRPTNEIGVLVSDKYFARISWAYNGLNLIAAHPFGYGLIEQSFGRLEKIEWPNSDLTQSHSGWIDLTLGIGIPGVLLIFLSLFLAILNIRHNRSHWGDLGFYYLLALALLWITTEVSQRVFFDSLIFIIALVTGLSLCTPSSNKK